MKNITIFKEYYYFYKNIYNSKKIIFKVIITFREETGL